MASHGPSWIYNYALYFHDFPRLRSLVIDYLAIPSSTSLTESLFSHCNEYRTPRRSDLSVSSINTYITVLCNELFTSQLEQADNEQDIILEPVRENPGAVAQDEPEGDDLYADNYP